MDTEEFIDAGDVVVVPARFYSRGRVGEIETVSRSDRVLRSSSRIGGDVQREPLAPRAVRHDAAERRL